MGDEVVRLEPGPRRRRVVDRRHHLDQALLHGDLDAEPAELAAGLHLHVAEGLGVHVARMRVEPGQHAVDGSLDQLLVGLLLDRVGAHAFEHFAEQVELAIGIAGVPLAALLGDDRRGQECKCGRAEGDRRDAEITLHPLTLLLPAANQG